ncbi:uncharacterized protein LOC120630279 [Pararge aegeria]|uniref:uncharacterized protein LOC120630279 n=1 Tax=Pararge aegeria TaxID=116150 RepID=UPI0019D0EA2D|nr:uncharacterized protein LOC120630279 [Pararge aegeria]
MQCLFIDGVVIIAELVRKLFCYSLLDGAGPAGSAADNIIDNVWLYRKYYVSYQSPLSAMITNASDADFACIPLALFPPCYKTRCAQC